MEDWPQLDCWSRRAGYEALVSKYHAWFCFNYRRLGVDILQTRHGSYGRGYPVELPEENRHLVIAEVLESIDVLCALIQQGTSWFPTIRSITEH
jgi:hypothetical protein